MYFFQEQLSSTYFRYFNVIASKILQMYILCICLRGLENSSHKWYFRDFLLILIIHKPICIIASGLEIPSLINTYHCEFLEYWNTKKSVRRIWQLFLCLLDEDSKNREEIEFSQWLFEGRLRQDKNLLPDGLNWLCYFAGNSKSHCENSIFFLFLESPHQVDMKDVVKC